MSSFQFSKCTCTVCTQPPTLSTASPMRLLSNPLNAIAESAIVQHFFKAMTNFHFQNQTSSPYTKLASASLPFKSFALPNVKVTIQPLFHICRLIPSISTFFYLQKELTQLCKLLGTNQVIVGPTQLKTRPSRVNILTCHQGTAIFWMLIVSLLEHV